MYHECLQSVCFSSVLFGFKLKCVELPINKSKCALWTCMNCTCDWCMKASPSQEESDVESRTVEVDKLKEEHLEGKTVLPLRLCPRLLCGGTGRKEKWRDKLIK